MATLNAIKQAATADDVPGFAEAVIGFAATEGNWAGHLRSVQEAVPLGQLPWRIEAAAAIAARLGDVPQDEARVFVDYLIDSLIGYPGRDAGLETARTVLGIAARYWEFTSCELEKLGKIVLKAGGEIDAATVAVIRRTAAIPEAYGRLREFSESLREPLLNAGEPWAERAMADLSTMEGAWRSLVVHAATVTEDAPPPRWERRAQHLLDQVGRERARQVITGWLSHLGEPRTIAVFDRAGGDLAYRSDRYNSRVLRALVWLLGFLPADAAQARLLGDLADHGLQKIPSQGARNRLVAEGAIYALSRVAGYEGLAQLVRLAAVGRPHWAAQEIDLALKDKARALHATREQLTGFAVSSFGLTETGLRVQRFGEDTGILRVTDGRVSQEWFNGNGVRLSSPPTAVKSGFPGQLREFRESAQQVGKALAALTAALRRELTAGHAWRYRTWRPLVLDHPVTGTLARRLLWLVDGLLCGYAAGALRPVAPPSPPSAPPAQALAPPEIIVDASAEVRLWRGGDDTQAHVWFARHGIEPLFPQTG